MDHHNIGHPNISSPNTRQKCVLKTKYLQNCKFGFMAVFKFLQLAEFLGQNGPHKLNKLQNFNTIEVWPLVRPLVRPLKNFLGFFQFF